MRNAIIRWKWKKGSNLWGNYRHTTVEKLGTIERKEKHIIKGSTYQAIALPFGALIVNYNEQRKSIFLQNRDAANSVFLSFGSKDNSEPNYTASIEIIAGQTQIFDNNVPVDDLYVACTLAAAQVLVSVTEGVIT